MSSINPVDLIHLQNTSCELFVKVSVFGNPYKVDVNQIKCQTRVEQCLYLFIELLFHIIQVSASFRPFGFDAFKYAADDKHFLGLLFSVLLRTSSAFYCCMFKTYVVHLMLIMIYLIYSCTNTR